MKNTLKSAIERFVQPFKAFSVALFGDPAKNQFQKIELAIRKSAQLVSDHEYNRVMHAFYTNRADTTDPHSDWWEFAQAKEKQKEYREEMDKLSKKIASADARLNGMQAAYRKLTNAS